MKILRYLANRIKDARGAATSLVEAGLTIGVGATLVGAALSGGLDAGNSAQVQVATEQLGQIAQAVVDFGSDLHIAPTYRNGNATGPNDATFEALVSENGTYPADLTGSWHLPTGAPYSTTDTSHRGHVVENSVHDSMEGQLNRDVISIGDVSTASASYPRKGSNSKDPNYGHALNYIKNDKLSVNGDPWTHKFLINVQDLNTGHLLTLKIAPSTNPFSSASLGASAFAALGAIAATTDPMPKIRVFAISAGPNGAIETAREQLQTTFVIGGDDIVTTLR